MFGKSLLAKALERWTEKGGNLYDFLSSKSSDPVRSKAEAKAICAALDALRAESDRASEPVFRSPLHGLTAFFSELWSSLLLGIADE
jgi:hypothetical protein